MPEFFENRSEHRFRLPHPAEALVIAALSVVSHGSAHAQATVPNGFGDQLVVGGFATPVGMAFLPDGRLLVIEQRNGRVRMISNGAIGPTDPVGTVPNVNTSGGERGLLGIAVDPRWPAQPYIYTHSTHTGTPSRIRISRFTATGDLDGTGNRMLAFDAATRYDLVTSIPDNANNHNGGTVRFGPDSMLYVSLGEDAVPCAAQDTSSLRGVILRLDVMRLPEGPGGPPAAALITPPGNPFPAGGLNARVVWAYGLRNPFRFHIDPLTGALFIGDVGQDSWEEADWAPQGGMNFGWPIREGNAAYSSSCAAVGALTGPIFAFDHGEGSSVMSAGIYRRPPMSRNGFPLAYEGDYFCSDYYTGFMWRMKRNGNTWAVAPAVPGQPSSSNWGTGFDSVSDYLVGPDGALWYCSQSSGQVRRVVSTAPDAMAPAATMLSEAAPPGPEE